MGTMASEKPGSGVARAEPVSSILEIPGYWRSLAADARATADQTEYPEAQRSMLGIAAAYDHMALRAEARITEKVALKKPAIPTTGAAVGVTLGGS
jgi:hypothetical protein